MRASKSSDSPSGYDREVRPRARFTVHETLVSVQRRISCMVLDQSHLVGADPRDLQSRIAAMSGGYVGPMSREGALRLAAYAVLHLRAVERAERVRVDTGDEAA